eukprot:gb/GFBE01014073.1/.p1 GENE.gb/GFBE01014073.1/~~gb/GFBE01014073.1/.p1  ORF type:complete len:347 (+),score=69.62 gb/GFBE01014073.1/:1-1041(+)
MSGFHSFPLLCVLFGAGHAAQFHGVSIRRESCKPSCLPNCPQSSRTGAPCLPHADVWPYKTKETWRSALGERIVKAAHPDPQVSEKSCHGFKLFGDSAWCLKALENDPEDVLGLSFGIEQRDLWSETMSNFFHMPTKLYDCFQDPSSSPPLAMTAPNAEGSCAGRSDHCYETRYEAFRKCLGAQKKTIEGREFGTLTELLTGRAPLSTHVKMDVEGSEWGVLKDLLKNKDDMARMRTLDMEVHFGFGSPPEGMTKEQQIKEEVEIFEKLAQHFAVTGSNVETNADGWSPGKDCAKQQCEEPAVHTKGGFSVNQFAISFVNRKFLKDGSKDNKQSVSISASGSAEKA